MAAYHVPHHRQSVYCFRVYDACVPPTASHGCEVWGCCTFPAASAALRASLTQQHLQTLKHILGVCLTVNTHTVWQEVPVKRLEWSCYKGRSSSTTGLLQPPLISCTDALRLPLAGLQCHRTCAIGLIDSVGFYKALAIHSRLGLMVSDPITERHLA